MALPLHTGGGKPEGPRSKFLLFYLYILMTSSPPASNLLSNPKTSLSEAPKLNDHWSKTTVGTSPFEKILLVSNGKCKRGQRPPANSQKNSEWERSTFSFPSGD
ncbi:hypothetical protein AVEN_82918-1 [Araneus ventricosus]|uniref:Uncharacterized protein n=1 Tax=Araneus ventricosus TaxID=182803 RepID=A0A4Y2KRJ3_ARAVE|nr:hypothetical protein AVEN_82918-1 [Araneus ventricosus]